MKKYSTSLITGGGGGLVARSCLTLCDPMDCNRPGSYVSGISQARKLEWVAIFPTQGSNLDFLHCT